MTLRKEPVHLNLSGGLQKKDDEFLVIPSKLAVADNVQFDDASTVVRRGGQTSLSLGAFNAIQVKRTFAHQGVAVLEQSSQVTRAGAGGVAQVLNPTTVGSFTPARAAPRAGMVTSRIGGVAPRSTAAGVGVPFYDGSFDCATIGNYTCYVFETRSVPLGTQTVRVVLMDDVNNFRVYDTVMTDGTNVLTKPRVVANASTFFIYVASFVSGALTFDVKVATLGTTGTYSGLSASIITGATGGGGIVEGTASDPILFDVAFSADLVRLGLVTQVSGAALSLYDLSTTTGLSTGVTGTVLTSAAARSVTALISKGATDYKLHAFYSINTNVIKAGNYNLTTLAGTAETTVGTGAVGSFVKRIAAYESSTTLIYLAFDCAATGGSRIPFIPTLRLSSFSHSYASLSECASVVGWAIAGRINVVNSRLYLPMMLVSSFAYQSTTFIIDLTSALGNLGTAGAEGAPPHVVARIDYGEGAIDITRWQPSLRVPGMPVRSNSLILPYLKYETNLQIVGGYSDTPFALARAVIDFDSQLQHEEINGVTFLAGASPQVFDGAVLVEEGFHHAPEIVEVLAAITGNTGTYDLPTAVAATYTVCFTYGWQDAQGNWHESAPSSEMSVTTTGANYSFTPVIVAPPTQKPGARLLMYRTKGSSTDTSLYLHTRSDGTQVTADADLPSGEQLYTSGNVLSNTPAPACRHVSTFQKRLVLSGCGDGSRVHWSKVTTRGFGVEFSSGDPTHQTVVPADKGRVVGTEEMDDRLFILCENGVCLSGGSGPNDSGTAGQYSDPATIITEVGASWDSPKSIVRGPEGIWFRSPFGMRLVSRSGGLGMAPDGKQAGAEVDSLVSGNVIAVVGDAKQQIRFFQTSGTCLVWDYQWKQWTRFTGMACVDAVYADDRYYCLSNYNTTTPLMRYTDETAFLDVNDSGFSSQVYRGYIETPWLSFAGIQGFQRVYRLLMLGRVTGSGVSDSHVLEGAIGYDFNRTSPPTTETFSALFTPGTAATFQVEHHFAKQKCEAIKIGLSMYPAQTAAGRFRLTDLTLQVGVKSGYNKLPSSSRY